ncbi:dethiobiotin synthase [Ekhidna sp. To15]|uniref:dethiobiotin synthase n=1 Tax=Ekhidna sp. To15 TaxID=3395267 RepID=UPI003F521267
MSDRYIVAGIGTDTGKTVISAILCKALSADYWKPVQAGDLDNTDSHKIGKWAPGVEIHPEAYRLTEPMSPHAAAEIDKVSIEESKLQLPSTDNSLIIELAGGLMVPLRDDFVNIDWVQKTNVPVVLVANYYLGSINHTLLTLSLLKSRNIPVLGIIFNGEKNQSSFEVIQKRSGLKCLLQVDMEESITPEIIKKYASRLKL